MKEIKLTIDGKEVQLTDEQLKLLGLEARKNPFDRVNGEYYLIDYTGKVDSCSDDRDAFDDRVYAASNYSTDKAFANQVALHQLFYRKLLKFVYDNGYEDKAEWNCTNRHWRIWYDHCNNVFDVGWSDIFQSSDVYFSTEEGAGRAIREVVIPFMKEHPEFVW